MPNGVAALGKAEEQKSKDSGEGVGGASKEIPKIPHGISCPIFVGAQRRRRVGGSGARDPCEEFAEEQKSKDSGEGVCGASKVIPRISCGILCPILLVPNGVAALGKAEEQNSKDSGEGVGGSSKEIPKIPHPGA